MYKNILISSGAIVALVGTQSAFSEERAGPSLEEVVVTAQRREESTQRAPIAITAMTAEEFAGTTDATDLSKRIPAIQIAPSQAQEPFVYLRGVGSLSGNSMTEPAVIFSLDGVPLARTYQAAGQFFDLERIEVLKGPQGTLYGRNATGGAINLIPRRPELHDFGGEAGIEIGNYDRVKADAALNLPLGSVAALRVAAQRVKRDGYYSDGAADEDGTSARIQWLLEPNTDLSFNLNLDYANQKGVGPGGVSLTGQTVSVGGASIAPGFPASERVGAADPRLSPIYATNLQFYDPSDRRNDNRFWGVTGTLDWTTDIGTLTLIPAYRKGELDFYALGGFGIGDKETDKQSSLEVRFASKQGSRLEWILGAFYLNDEVNALYLADAANPVPFGAGSPFSFTNLNTYQLETESTAVFADGTFNITESFRLLGGVRYTSEDKTIDGEHLSDGPLSSLNPLILDDKQTEKATTWRFGAQWDLSDDSMLYATVSKGFHSGGFFFTHDDPVYDPEFLKAYTLGSKNRFLDGRLEANIEAFYWDYTGQQTSHITFDSLGAVVFATENVGAVDIKGVELETQYLVTRDTLLIAQAQYLDSKYDEFSYVQPFIPPRAGCDISGGPIFVVDCAGRRPPLAPEWSINLEIQQTVPLPNGASLVADLRTHYQSDTQTTVEDVPLGLQDAYWVSDASLAYEAERGAWKVTAFINNISDETILATTFANPFSGVIGPPLYFGQLQAPRTYGARLLVKF